MQGNCRFADKCRFEHPYGSNDYGDSGYDYSYQNRGRSQASYTSNYDQNRNRHYNDKYQPNQQYYSSGRNYQDSRYSYNDGSYNQAPEPDYNANKYNRNKHTWVSEDYKKQIEPKLPKSNNERFFDTSTPKSKVSFSFKDTSVQKSHHQPGDLHMNERNLIDAEIIKEDVLLWETGNQWPFSCYCPTQGKSAFPGFVDLSPEELRLEAYKARENNTYNSYVESVEKTLQEMKMKREQLKEPSIQLMIIIERIRKGEKFETENTVDGSFSSLVNSNQTGLEEMVAEEVPQTTSTSFFGPLKSAADSFSFKTTLGNDEAIKNSASTFSFKTPSESSAASFSFKTSTADSGRSQRYKLPMVTFIHQWMPFLFKIRSSSQLLLLLWGKYLQCHLLKRYVSELFLVLFICEFSIVWSTKVNSKFFHLQNNSGKLQSH
ncbi:hypothetical protein JTE90_012822 [Oedothorax gibbosus]|uniref:Nucleoporin NUP42 n=1 Tax=Oedothorax gibbosus TaxID=931172 RepID=A0AAV6W0D2_9ARAC|nr:hypothetical protein JTE90_012822 [Oedothorax gibbosus]